MRTPRDILNAAGIALKGYAAGEHRSACPKCAVEKQRPHDRALAVLIHDSGVTWLCHRCGWKSGGKTSDAPAKPKDTPRTDAQKREGAARLWRGARPDPGIIKTYLAGRGIATPVPSHCIRYHPRCPRGKDERLPAMVAAMVNVHTNELTTLHRTFLKSDGSGKIEHGTAKMYYSSPAGAVVKLCPDEEVTIGLGIAEGIETALSLISIGWASVWACGDAGGIKTFPVLSGIEALTVFSDNDENEVGIEAARACMRRWRAAGREADIIYPGAIGVDWNDVVKGAAA